MLYEKIDFGMQILKFIFKNKFYEFKDCLNLIY